MPKKEIIGEKYDLSFSRYKDDIFVDIEYEKPPLILGKLKQIESGIEKELSELEGMLR